MLPQLMITGSALISGAVTISLLVPIVLYLVARWRAVRGGASDPHLGLKVVLHWFATASFHIALSGGALLIYAMISADSGGKGALYRAAFALLVPALIVTGVHHVAIKRTNDEELPTVRRLFLGYNLFVTGIVAFGALLFGFQILFAKGSAGGAGHIAGALVLTYGTAWGLLGWRFAQLVLGAPGAGGGEPPPEVVLPPAPAVPPPASGGLPSLGGGSYPPLQK